MGYTLGRFYACLPGPTRWCCTKLLLLAGLVCLALFICASAMDAKDLPAWIANGKFNFAVIGLIGFIAGVLGNVAADRYLKWEALRLPSVKQFFQNHDLTKLVGQSLGMVLRAAGDQLSDHDDGRTVYRLARYVEKNWIDISTSEQGQRKLFAIQDRQLLDFIRDPRKPALNYQQAEARLALAKSRRSWGAAKFPPRGKPRNNPYPNYFSLRRSAARILKARFCPAR